MESLVNWLGWKCTLRPGALLIGFWLAFWCAFIRNANCTRAVFAFCFSLASCEHQVERIRNAYERVWFSRMLCWNSTTNRIPNIPQCTLLSRPVYQNPFQFFEGLVPRLSRGGQEGTWGYLQWQVTYYGDVCFLGPVQARIFWAFPWCKGITAECTSIWRGNIEAG